jgi:hypothetical protein
VVEFINTAVIILLVNFRLNFYLYGIPIIAGQYSEFSVDWYKMVGSTIILTMLLRLVTPHIITCGNILITGCKRWYDRKWTLDRQKTRQVLQEDYEEINSGSEFTLDSRYASMLTTIFMVMMYSPGMPMMYVIGFAYFFITYWTDKALCKFIENNCYSIEMEQETSPLYSTFGFQDKKSDEVLSNPSLRDRLDHVH